MKRFSPLTFMVIRVGPRKGGNASTAFYHPPPLLLLGFWQNIAVIMAKVSPNRNTPDGTIAGWAKKNMVKDENFVGCVKTT